MELVTILATVILLATFVTLFFSFAAYFVTRIKKRRQQEPSPAPRTSEPSAPAQAAAPKPTPAERRAKIFERYTPRKEPEKKHVDPVIVEKDGDQWT